VIKSRRLILAGHVACMGERRGVHRELMENPEGKNHLKNLEIDGRTLLK
jgi:hypothetical protein